MDDQPGFLTVFIILMLILIFGIALGTSEERAKAVEAKVAEYRIDKTTGATTFQYLTPKLNSEREK